MPRSQHPRPSLAAALLAVLLVAAACGTTTDAGSPAVAGGPALTAPAPATTLRPVPGHEVYGFVPYWEMDDGIAEHLRATPLTTLALFSVTNTGSGTIDTRQEGHSRITSDRGRTLIREAHERGARVELVFTSFGRDRNDRFFARPELRDTTIGSLVELVGAIGVDGINVDVEGLAPRDVPAYGGFVGRLRDALVAANPSAEVSVATQANALGGAMAAAAVGANADRVFLMGYDYRVAGSMPGATSPLDRRDGEEKDLSWSLDLYAALGVPVARTLLGLPLYGMAWPAAGPVIGAPRTGRGEAWIPRRNTALIGDPSVVPLRDETEMVEVYLIASDGSVGPPPVEGSSPPGAEDRTWEAVYVDSPATLAPKLALANARGLAGAGFWAIGYERGLLGYTSLIARFAAGAAL